MSGLSEREQRILEYMREYVAKWGYPPTVRDVAGALGIRLGGLNYYFGKPSFRTYMGDPVHALEANHISLAIRMMYTVTVMFLALMLAASWLLGGSVPGGLML